jgi:hypothetical protein
MRRGTCSPPSARTSRSYLVADAITGSAYTSALTSKDYGIALAIAIFGLVLTALASAAGLREVKAASRAEPALAELQTGSPARWGSSRSA